MLCLCDAESDHISSALAQAKWCPAWQEAVLLQDGLPALLCDRAQKSSCGGGLSCIEAFNIPSSFFESAVP